MPGVLYKTRKIFKSTLCSHLGPLVQLERSFFNGDNILGTHRLDFCKKKSFQVNSPFKLAVQNPPKKHKNKHIINMKKFILDVLRILISFLFKIFTYRPFVTHYMWNICCTQYILGLGSHQFSLKLGNMQKFLLIVALIAQGSKLTFSQNMLLYL